MSGHSWKYLKVLQDTARDGLNRISHDKKRETENSLRDELILDLVPLVIGLFIYIQLDVYPIVPSSLLPDFLQDNFMRTMVAVVGLALAAFGGVRIIFAQFETIIWHIGSLFQRKKQG